MDTFIKIINCCYQEETKTNQNNIELKVPITPIETLQLENKPEQNQMIIDNSEPLIIESTNIKTNSNNIASNNTNNTSNNLLILDDSSNINVNNNITNGRNINTDIDLKTSFSPSKKKVIYSNSISNNQNMNKIFNTTLDVKKLANSLISKSNASKNNKSNNTNNTILTLNDLILINQNQNQEEKNNEIIGSKLLLSGELFFWKEIIISSNGIKTSLRKEKDEHVFFGVKNILNKSGEPYNDLIINFFYHDEDTDLLETNTGRAFEIFYNKRVREYVLRFLHPNIIL